MNSTDNWLEHEHSLYEDLLSQCMNAVEMEDRGTVNQAFNKLVTRSFS